MTKNRWSFCFSHLEGSQLIRVPYPDPSALMWWSGGNVYGCWIETTCCSRCVRGIERQCNVKWTDCRQKRKIIWDRTLAQRITNLQWLRGSGQTWVGTQNMGTLKGDCITSSTERCSQISSNFPTPDILSESMQ
jgi:hypothetical protein